VKRNMLESKRNTFGHDMDEEKTQWKKTHDFPL
jgi:hypothetical protein